MARTLYYNTRALSVGARTSLDRFAIIHDDTANNFEAFVRATSTGSAESGIAGTVWIQAEYTDASRAVVKTLGAPAIAGSLAGTWQVVDSDGDGFEAHALPTVAGYTAGNAMELDSAKTLSKIFLYYQEPLT